MAGRTFETQAVIKLIDQLTGPMSSLAKSMQGIQKTMASDAERAQAEMARSSETHFARMKAAAKDAFAGMAVAAGVEATHIIREMSHVGYEMDKIMSKYQALGRYSDTVRDAQQKYADVGDPRIGRDPKTQAEAMVHAMQAGIEDPAKQNAFTNVARGYAQAANMPLPEAVTELADHVMMMGDMRGPTGNKLSFNQASQDQIEHEALLAAGRMEIFARHSNQTSRQVYDYMRTAGPAANSMGVGFEDIEVMGAQMATAGIKGEEAGTAMKTLLSRSVVPTAQGRAVVRELGLNMNDYVHIKPDRVKNDDLDKMFEARIGSLSASSKASINAVADRFRTNLDPDAYLRDMADALHGTGSRNMKNRVAAGNLARDSMIPFSGGMDIGKFVGDLMNKVGKDGAVAVLTQLYGKNQAGRLVNISPVSADAPGGLRDQIRAEGDPAAYEKGILDKTDASYAAAMDRLNHSYEGALDQLFKTLEPAIIKLADAATQMAQYIGNMSDPMKVATASLIGLAAAASVAWGVMTGWRVIQNLSGKSSSGRLAPMGSVEPQSLIPTTAETAAAPKASEAPREMFGPENRYGPWKPPTTEQLAADAGMSVRDYEQSQIQAERAAEAAQTQYGKTYDPNGHNLRADLALQEKLGELKDLQAAARAQEVELAAGGGKSAGLFEGLATKLLGPTGARMLGFASKAAGAAGEGFALVDIFDRLKAEGDKNPTIERLMARQRAMEAQRGAAPTLSPSEQAAAEDAQRRASDPVGQAQIEKERARLLKADRAISGGLEPVDGVIGDGTTSAIRSSRVGLPAPSFLVPQVAVPTAPEREVHVSGDAQVNQVIDIRLSGLEGLAGEVQRRVESRFQVNLGSGMQGGQGLRPQPAPAQGQ